MKFIAGGTNLLDLMKADVMRPRHLVDITRLPLGKIEDLPGGGLRLGALVTNADTAYDPRVAGRYPMLSRAILAGASAQLRNMATNGGNLLQRTRCYYFYDTATPCNKREPGSGCAAIDGVNRIHAILGASEHCIATHPSDMCVALAALAAVVRVDRPGRRARHPVRPSSTACPATRRTWTPTSHPDEVITAIDLPPDGFAEHCTYLKVRDRASYAFALVSVAAGLEMDGGADPPRPASPWAASPTSRGATPRPRRCWSASRRQRKASGPSPTPSWRGAKGYGHNTFKIELARRAIVRALEEAAGLGGAEP